MDFKGNVGFSMVEYDDVVHGIKDLIQKYDIRKFELGEKSLKEIGEANIRKDFVDKLFSVLGWKTDDPREYDSENYVRGVGHADIAIKVDAKPLIFIEAKRFGGVPSRIERGVQLTLAGQKIYSDWTAEERQVLNYAGMSVDAKWAILTNFEKFRLFNSKTGETVLDIETPNEYLERIEARARGIGARQNVADLSHYLRFKQEERRCSEPRKQNTLNPASQIHLSNNQFHEVNHDEK